MDKFQWNDQYVSQAGLLSLVNSGLRRQEICKAEGNAMMQEEIIQGHVYFTM